MPQPPNIKLSIGPSIALYAATGEAADPPNRLVICKWGENVADDGKLYVDDYSATALAINNKHPWSRVPLDFEHSTERPEIPFPKPIAAYGDPRVIPGEGVVLENLEWTPMGVQAWQAKSYADISPCLILNKKGEVVFIKSAALTTNGRIQGLHLYSANLPITEDTQPMDYKQILITLLIALGATDLKPDATDEAITAAADTLGKKEKTEPEVKPAPETSELKQLSARLDGIEAKAIKDRKGAAVQVATKEGKLITFSAEEIDQLPEPLLYSHLAKLKPGQVPFKSETSHAQPGSGVQLQTDPEVELYSKNLSAQLGLSEEDLKTYANA